MTNLEPEVKLPSGCLRVLSVILQLADENTQPITLRRIKTRIPEWSQKEQEGQVNVGNHLHRLVHHLRDLGFITFEDHAGGTIRPTCRMRMYKELSAGSASDGNRHL